jgi:hypothetical protein
MALQWATAVAIRVSHSDPSYRIKVNWVKKTDRSSSPVSLVDEENSQYYFPVATDFAGEVLPGHPMVGIVVFEPFRASTSKVLLRIAGARFTAEKFTPELNYRLESEKLRENIDKSLFKPPLADQLSDQLHAQRVKAQQLVAQKPSGGCLITAIATIGAVALGITKLLVS